MNGNHPATIPAENTDDMSSESMTINVPPEMQDQIAGWQDGGKYQITITQSGPGMFDLESVDNENAGGDEAGPTNDTDAERINPGSANDTGGTTIPSKNPAVMALIMSKRGKK